MKIAYKGFEKGLKCRGYQFRKGINRTEKAQTAACGFHCAENPLDCLSYYPDITNSEYWLVSCSDDYDEDAYDSKIATTELNIIRKLDISDYLLHCLIYVSKHIIESITHVDTDTATANYGYAIVRGKNPIAKGKLGDWLGFVRTDGKQVHSVSLFQIDGKEVKENTYYTADKEVFGNA